MVSRQVFIDSRSSSVICAPVYTNRLGLRTEVPVGPEEGLKHPSSLHCDRLVSIEKARLTSYVGALKPESLRDLREALRAALAVE